MDITRLLLACGVTALAACSSDGGPDASAALCPAQSPPDFAKAYRCYGNVAGAAQPAILLIPGTTQTPEINFSWNWFRALDQLGLAYCTIEIGDHGMNDIQESAEYIAYGIRETYRRSGNRKIRVMGHSQGGMISRWAFKYWPGTRSQVEELVGWAPSNHGTVVARGFCNPDCAPAIWQQRDDAAFIAALNSGAETYPEIDYTVVYTHYDEVVTPNVGPNASSPLKGGANVANIAVQDLCPGNTADHLSLGTYDPVAYALTLDAFNNPGPAKASRIPATVCAEVFQPGVNPATFASDYAPALQEIGRQTQTYPKVRAEPALKCYASP